jgi:hypothetical protein
MYSDMASSVPLEILSECFLDGAYAFVDAHREEWLPNQDVDLEVTNHVLRIHIQDGSIALHIGLIESVCACQHANGGWGDTRDDAVSRLRSTSFCAQMLLRANRVLKDPAIETRILDAIGFILSQQDDSGEWTDHKWHFLDALSVSVGTLLFAVREQFADDRMRVALERGMAAVSRHRNPQTHLWHYKPKGSPVTISAHLLQKYAIYYAGTNQREVTNSMDALIDLQCSDGAWDKGNVDHTCDVTRSLMLCAGIIDEPKTLGKVKVVAESALRWILSAAVDGGLPDRVGHRPHVERTCDGIDTVLKYRQLMTHSAGITRFWQ